MWESFENIGLQTSEKVRWGKKKHAQNIRSTVHRTGDLKTDLLTRYGPGNSPRRQCSRRISGGGKDL